MEVFCLAGAKNDSLQGTKVHSPLFIVQQRADSFVYANRSLFLARGGEADLTIWPQFGPNEFPPAVWSFPHLVDCHHKRAHSQEVHNFSLQFSSKEKLTFFFLVPWRVAELTEIFKMIYTNCY